MPVLSGTNSIILIKRSNKGENPDSILSELTLKGLNEYYSENIPETVLKNVHKELKLIKKLNYAPYFLTVYDIVMFAKKKGSFVKGVGLLQIP